MPNNPKITVILPCFNHAQFLDARIKSVLSQTHPVDQIIFLDDASSDGSTDIAKRLLAGFPGEVDYRLNIVNSGSPFAQWNTGISLAKHELIWIAETDDSCDPQLIEVLYEALVSSGAVLGYCQSRYIDEKGESLGSLLSYTDRCWPDTFRNSFSMDGTRFNWLYMTGLNAIPNASAVLFRKDAYLSSGRANEAMRFCGDWDAWIRICTKGRVEFVADELNYFRCHTTSSRAFGYTSYVAAEYFACKLRACIGETSIMTPSLSAIDMIKGLLDPQSRLQWDNAVKSLELTYLPEARRRYQVLPDFPRLDESTWTAIKLVHCCDTAGNQLSSLVIRLMRLPSKMLRFTLKVIEYRY